MDRRSSLGGLGFLIRLTGTPAGVKGVFLRNIRTIVLIYQDGFAAGNCSDTASAQGLSPDLFPGIAWILPYRLQY